MSDTIKINEEQTNNPSAYLDAPITGGDKQLVINKLQILQAIRTPLAIQNWDSAIRIAISRYYPNRRQLYDIYESALDDGHLSGIIRKRLDTVLNKELQYKDANGEPIEDMAKPIRTIAFRNIMKLILEAQMWGISGIEFVPGPELRIRAIPRKHIKTRTQKIAIEQNSQDEGFDYTKLDNIWIIGEPEDLGLLRQCSMYVTYKRTAIGDWATFIEMFGMPIREVKYDPNDEVAAKSLEKLGQESGSALFMLIPKTADFELHDSGGGNANGDLQHKFVSLMNQEMSITVLGNTETTGGEGGSLAKSKTHQEQQNEISKSDIRYLEAWLNDPHFLHILKSYGLPVTEGAKFQFDKDMDIAFLTARAAIDQGNIKAGVNLTQKYMQETYAYPDPKPTDTIIKISEVQAQEKIEATPSGATPAKPKPATKPTDLTDDTPGFNMDALATLIANKLKDTSFFG